MSKVLAVLFVLLTVLTLVGCQKEAPAQPQEPQARFVAPVSLQGATAKAGYQTLTTTITGVVSGVQSTRYGQHVVEVTRTDKAVAVPELYTIKVQPGLFVKGDKVVGTLNVYDELVALRKQ